jgi:hypothetical protein
MADSQSPSTEQTELVAAPETATEPPPKKSVNPAIAIVLILVLLGGVFYFYSKGTEDKVFRLPNKKGAAAPHHP